jgi:hypothetical protein
LQSFGRINGAKTATSAASTSPAATATATTAAPSAEAAALPTKPARGGFHIVLGEGFGWLAKQNQHG